MHYISLSLTPHPPTPIPSLSVTLPLTDRPAKQTSAVYEEKNLPGDQGSSEKAEVKRKVLGKVLNCEGELLCRMWEGRLFQTSGA